jgi:hypothetical protein
MKFPNWLKIYGDLTYREKCATETLEQITFFNFIRTNYPIYGRIAIHPRNEGKRTFYQASMQKFEGMTQGAADIIIPGSPSFVCELKRRDHTKSKWEPGQLEYLGTCQKIGAFVCVALGYDEAIQAFNDWRIDQ